MTSAFSHKLSALFSELQVSPFSVTPLRYEYSSFAAFSVKSSIASFLANSVSFEHYHGARFSTNESHFNIDGAFSCRQCHLTSKLSWKVHLLQYLRYRNSERMQCTTPLTFTVPQHQLSSLRFFDDARFVPICGTKLGCRPWVKSSRALTPNNDTDRLDTTSMFSSIIRGQISGFLDGIEGSMTSYFSGIGATVTTLVASLISAISSAIIFITCEGFGISTLAMLSATSSFIAFAHACYRILQHAGLTYDLSKVEASIPSIVASMSKTLTPNADELDFSSVTSWMKRIGAILITILVFGLTKAGFCEAKDVIEQSRLVQSVTTFTSAFSTVSNEVASLLGWSDSISGISIGHALEKLSNEISTLLSTPMHELLCSSELLARLETIGPEISDHIRKSDADEKGKFVSLKASLVSRLNTLDQRKLEVRQCLNSDFRVDPMCFVLYGQPAIGKTYLTHHLFQELAKRLHVSSQFYDLAKQPGGKHYNTYANEYFAVYDEYLKHLGKDPIIEDFNKIFSSTPANLTGPALSDKKQYVKFAAAIMTTNTNPPEMGNHLNSMVETTRKAFFSRQTWYHVTDPMAPDRDQPQIHRQDDFSHLMFKRVTMPDWHDPGPWAPLDPTPENFRQYTLAAMLDDMTIRIARKEREYWINGDKLLKFEGTAVREFRAYRMTILDRILQHEPNVLDVGKRFFSVAFEGPPCNGKTAAAESLANDLCLYTGLPVSRTLTNTPAIFILDDISLSGDLLQGVNAIDSSSILIWVRHRTYNNFSSSSIKRAASHFFSKVSGRPSVMDNDYFQTCYPLELVGFARRSGCSGLVYNKCPDTGTTCDFTINVLDGVTYQYTRGAQVNEFPSNRSATESEMFGRTAERYMLFLRSIEKCIVSYEKPPVVDEDIKIKSDTKESLLSCLSSKSNVIRAFTGTHPDTTITISDRVLSKTSSNFAIADFLLANTLQEGSIQNVLFKLTNNLLKLAADVQYSIRTSNFSATYNRGILYLPSVTNTADTAVLDTNNQTLVIDTGRGRETITWDAAIEAIIGSPSQLRPHVVLSLRKWHSICKDDYEFTPFFSRLRLAYDTRKNSQVAVTSAAKWKTTKGFTIVAVLVGCVLAAILAAKVIKMVYNYVTENSTDLLKTHVPKLAKMNPHPSLTKEQIKIISQSQVVRVKKLTPNSTTIPKAETMKPEDIPGFPDHMPPTAYYHLIYGPWPPAQQTVDAWFKEDYKPNYNRMSEEDYAKYVAAREAKERSSMGPREHEEWRSWSNTPYGRMVDADEERWAERNLRGWEPNSLKHVKPVDNRTTEYESTRRQIEQNVGVVQSSLGKCHGIGLRDHHVITVGHTFNREGETCSFTSDELGTVYGTVAAINRRRDLAFIALDPAACSKKFKDLTNLLLPDDQLQQTTRGWFVRYGDGVDSFEGSLLARKSVIYPDCVAKNYEPTRCIIEFESMTFSPTDTIFKKGDCGFPLLAQHKGRVYLAGFHNATATSLATFAYLTTEDLPDMVKRLSDPELRYSYLLKPLRPNATDDSVDTNNDLAYKETFDGVPLMMYKPLVELSQQLEEPRFESDHIRVLGTHPKLVDYNRDKDKFVCLGDRGLENKNSSGPAVTNVNDPRLKDVSGLTRDKSGKPSIAMTQYKKFTLRHSNATNVDMDVFKHAVDHVKQYNQLHFGTLRILSEKRAINGIDVREEGLRLNLNKLDMKKSAGPTYKIFTKTMHKGGLFQNLAKENQEPFYTYADTPAGSLCSHLAKLRYVLGTEGIGIIGLNKGCLKRELRPLDKIKVGKTRLFNAVDTDIVIHQCRLYGDLLAKMMARQQECVSTVGCDPIRDFTMYHHRMMEIAGSDFTGDFETFDKTMWYLFRKYLSEMVAEMVSDSKLTPEQIRAIYAAEAAASASMWAIIEAHFCHTESKDGNFSGERITSLLNDFANHVNFVYSILRKMQVPQRSLPSFAEVEIRYRLNTNGDDNKSRMCHSLDMTFEHLIKTSSELGFKLTPADKGAGISQTYLSRTVDLDKRHNVVFPALKKVSVLHTLHFVPDMSIMSIAHSFNSVIFEAALWDEEFYASIRRDVFKQIAKLSNVTAREVRTRIRTESYSDMRSKIADYIRYGEYPTVTPVGLEAQASSCYISFEKLSETHKNYVPNNFKYEEYPPTYSVAITQTAMTDACDPVSCCNLWFQAHPDQVRPVDSYISSGTPNNPTWTITTQGTINFTGNPPYNYVYSGSGPNKPAAKEVSYGKLWHLICTSFADRPLSSRTDLVPAGLFSLPPAASLDVLSSLLKVQASIVKANGDATQLSHIHKVVDSLYTSAPLAEGYSYSVLDQFGKPVAVAGRCANSSAPFLDHLDSQYPQLRTRAVSEIHEYVADSITSEWPSSVPIVFGLPNTHVAYDQGVLLVPGYTLTPEQYHTGWLKADRGSLVLDVQAFRDILKIRSAIRKSPNMDSMSAPVGEVIPQAPRATNATGAAAGPIPVGAPSIGAVSAIDMPSAPAAYASSDQTSQSVTLEIPSGIPNMTQFNLNTYNIWNYATRPMDNGTPITISGSLAAGTIAAVFPYGANMSYAQGYARAMALLHKVYHGPIYLEFDMQAVPMMMGSIIIGVLRNTPPSTQTTIPIIELQKIAWVELHVSGTQTHTFKLNDARKTNFFRNVADDSATDFTDRPCIVIAIHQMFQNQFPEGTTDVNVRVRHYFDPVEFVLAEPVDSGFAMLTQGYSPTPDQCGRINRPPREISGLRFIDVFPELGCNSFLMSTDGNLGAPVEKNCAPIVGTPRVEGFVNEAYSSRYSQHNYWGREPSTAGTFRPIFVYSNDSRVVDEVDNYTGTTRRIAELTTFIGPVNRRWNTEYGISGAVVGSAFGTVSGTAPVTVESAFYWINGPYVTIALVCFSTTTGADIKGYSVDVEPVIELYQSVDGGVGEALPPNFVALKFVDTPAPAIIQTPSNPIASSLWYWNPFYQYFLDVAAAYKMRYLSFDIVSPTTSANVATVYFGADIGFCLYEPGLLRQYKLFPADLAQYAIANVRPSARLETIGTDTATWIDRSSIVFNRNAPPTVPDFAPLTISERVSKAFKKTPNGNPWACPLEREIIPIAQAQVFQGFVSMRKEPNGAMLSGQNFQNSAHGSLFALGADQLKGKQQRDFYEKMMREGFSHEKIMAAMSHEFNLGLMDQGAMHAGNMMNQQQEYLQRNKFSSAPAASYSWDKNQSGRNGARGMVHATHNDPREFQTPQTKRAAPPPTMPNQGPLQKDMQIFKSGPPPSTPVGKVSTRDASTKTSFDPKFQKDGKIMTSRPYTSVAPSYAGQRINASVGSSFA